MSNKLGDKIRKLRKDQNLTLDELAKRTESSKGYIWELENRDTRRPSAEKLMKIAEILETTTDFLLDTNKAEPDNTDLQATLYRNFEKLDEDDQKRFLKMVKDWGNSE